MTATRIDVAAAQDALARLDKGAPLPGDEALAEQYDRFLQAAWDRYEAERYEAERAEWLAVRCGGCEPGGTGDPCDNHYEEEATL